MEIAHKTLEKRRAEIQRALEQALELRARAIAAAQEAEGRIQQLQGQLALVNDLLAPNGQKAPKGKK